VETLKAARRLGHALDHEAEYSEAEPLLRRSVDGLRHALGEEHSDTLEAMADLASLYEGRGKLAEAEMLYIKTLDGRRRAQGDEHNDTLSTMNNLAVLYMYQKKFAQAEPLLVKVLEVRRRVLRKDHPSTLVVMMNLGGLYHNQGQLARAERLMVEALEIMRRVKGEDHPDTLACMRNLAFLYKDQRQYPKAKLLLVREMEVRRRVPGPHPPGLWNCIFPLVGLILGGPDLSDDDRSRGLELARKLTELGPYNHYSWKWLGVAEYGNGHWDAAIAAENRCIALRKDQGWRFQHLILAMAHARRGDRAEAQRWYEKVQAVILLPGAPGWNDTPRWLIDEAKTLFGLADLPEDVFARP
jgi:tetratricopeptide (TPR) repeat protein